MSESIVLAVADATNTDPLSLPPLGEAIDPDTLEGFADRTTSGWLTFSYAGTEVTVTHDGEVTVQDALPARESDRQPIRPGISD